MTRRNDLTVSRFGGMVNSPKVKTLPLRPEQGRQAKGSVQFVELPFMGNEIAHAWLNYVDLDWVDDDESIDAVLGDVSALQVVEECGDDENAA